ncbi:MAG: hypothetical protein ACRCXA_03405 [Peptostreptococcaceae bacterium]
MKKIITITLLTMLTITGCSKVTASTGLSNFYLESIINKTEDISLEEVKKSLEDFEYEYDLQQYSKEELESYEDEFGEKLELPDFSYNTFSNKDSSIEIIFNETDKKIESSSYTENKKNISKTINQINDICTVDILGEDVEYQKEMINRLNLYKETTEVVNLYFELVNNLKNNEAITIKDIENTLNSKYEKRKEEGFGENYYIYNFETEDERTDIEIDVDNEAIVSIKMNLEIDNYTNYRINLQARNKDLMNSSKGFSLEMNIYSILNQDMEDKSEEEIKTAYNDVNNELFEFVYKSGKLKFYSEEYDKSKTNIIETRYNKEEEAYVIIPNDKRVVADTLFTTSEQTVTTKLKKGEKINLEINTESEIGKIIGISIVDLVNGKEIYKEEIEAKRENIISSKEVYKDGEYEILFSIDNIEGLNIKIDAIKMN